MGDSDFGSVAGDRPKKYHEGWVYHRAGNSSNTKDQQWTRLWMALRGEHLYIFKNERTCNENLIGTLHLSEHASCRNLQSRSRNSYKLEVSTIGINGHEKVNHFKFDKEIERDVWKSFIIGIAVGIVPSDVHLLPGQLKDVHEAIVEVRNVPPPLPSIPRPRVDPTLTAATAFNKPYDPSDDTHTWGGGGKIYGLSGGGVNNNTKQFKSNYSDDDHSSNNSGSFKSHVTRRPQLGDGNVHNLRDLRSRQTDLAFKSLDTPSGLRGGESSGHVQSPPASRYRDDGSEDSGYSHNGGSNESHLFHRDPDRNRDTPSWFFENLAREDAENALTCGRKFGNVLMRPSSSWATSQKYVISMRREIAGGTTLNHYEVIKSSEGFKINVDNPRRMMLDEMDRHFLRHAPMGCLSEVMDFFVNVAGPGTKPMRTNDMSRIYSATISNSSDGYPSRASSTATLVPSTPTSPPPPPTFTTMDRMAQNSFDFPIPSSPTPPNPESNWSFGPPPANTSRNDSSSSWNKSAPSTPSNKLNVQGNVSSGIALAVSEMNQDLGRHHTEDDFDGPQDMYVNVNRDGGRPDQTQFAWEAKPSSRAVYSRSNDQWSDNSRAYGRSDSYGTSRPNYNNHYDGGPPPEHGYRDSGLNQPVPAPMQRQYGTRDDVPPPPPFSPPPPAPTQPPPPPPAPPGGPGIPAPPPMNSQGYRTMGNPSQNGPPGPPPNAFNTTPNPRNNNMPPRGYNAAPSFEDELKGRLVGQREQIYSSGAQILKNW